MFLRFIKFFIFVLIIFFIQFIFFETKFKEFFPEGNIVSIEKKEKLLNKKIIFEKQKPDKIISKWIFISKNQILTVAHWIGSFDDDYRIFFENISQPKIAKLIFRDKKKDFAILKTKENFSEFLTVNFADYKNQKNLHIFKNWKYEKIEVSKSENEKIFVKKEFLPWDSGTIFFNEKKEIIWILSEYDLKNKLWIVNIFWKDFLKEKTSK